MSFAAPSRRHLLQAGGLVAIGLHAGAAYAAGLPIVIHRDAACGCCGAWVDHIRASQAFQPVVRLEPDMATIKARLGVPPALAACHTAEVAGYLVEGHVPAADILRLLKTRPRSVIGLAVPGMPAGSPGMEVPGRPTDYAVLAFDLAGSTTVFARHKAAAS